MRVFTEVSVTLKGDEAAARRNIPLARTLLGIMKSVNTQTNEVQRWRRTLPDGTRVDLASFHGRDYIQIESPTESSDDLLGGISYQTLEDAYRIVLPELFVDIVDYSQNKRAIYVRKDTPSWDEQANSYLSGGNIPLPTDRDIVGVIQAGEDGIEHVFAVFKTETTFNLEYYRRTLPSPSLVLTTTHTITEGQEFTFEFEGLVPDVSTKFSVELSEILPAFTYNLLGTEAYCILICKPNNPEEGCGVVSVILKLSIGTGVMVVDEHLKGGHLFVAEHAFVGDGETGVNIFANPELRYLAGEAGTYNGDLTQGTISSRITTEVHGTIYVDLGISEEGTLLVSELTVEGGEQNDWQFTGDNPEYTLGAASRPALAGYAIATGFGPADILASPEAVADAWIAAQTGTYTKGSQSAGPGSASGLFIGGACTIIYEVTRTDVEPDQTFNLPIYEVYIDSSQNYLREFEGEIQHNPMETEYRGNGSASQAVVGILLSDDTFYSLDGVPDSFIETNQLVVNSYSSDIVAKLIVGGQTIEHRNYAFGPLVVGAYTLIKNIASDLSPEAQLTATQRDPGMGLGPISKSTYDWSIPFNGYQATNGVFNPTISLSFHRDQEVLAEEIYIDSIDTENLSALIFKDVVGFNEARAEVPVVDPGIQYNTTINLSITNDDIDKTATSYRVAFDSLNSSSFLVSPGGYSTFYDFGILGDSKSLIRRVFPLRASSLLLEGASPLITASYSAVYDRADIAFFKSSTFASWRTGEVRAALFRDSNMDPITTYIYRNGVFEVDPFPEETILEPLRAHYV